MGNNCRLRSWRVCGGDYEPWSRGWLGHIIAGVIGALLGEVLIGPIGPELAGMTVMPAAIGAVAVTLIMMLLIQWSRVR